MRPYFLILPIIVSVGGTGIGNSQEIQKREMPIWGQTYREKAEENYFNRRAFPWDTEPFVRARILALTEYVARLQVNQPKAK